MTKFYVVGDKSRAICPHCEKLVETTFAYRDVPFDDGVGMAKNILVATCDECGTVVAIPAQSTPAIRKARPVAEIPLEVSLTAPELEILDAAAFQIDSQATSRFRKAIFTYYLSRLERDADELEVVKHDLTEWIIERKRKISAKSKIPSRRLSFKLSSRTEQKLEVVLRKTGWNKTNLMRGVVMMVEKDILENKSCKPVQELQEIAEAVNA
jgi:endogenous inhibitor of DNA gyrase (YacG/DUF329 family)